MHLRYSGSLTKRLSLVAGPRVADDSPCQLFSNLRWEIYGGVVSLHWSGELPHTVHQLPLKVADSACICVTVVSCMHHIYIYGHIRASSHTHESTIDFVYIALNIMDTQRSFDDLLARVSIADSPCSDEHLKRLGLKLSEWRVVAMFLGLEENEIEDIQERAKSTVERAIRMLRRWREIGGEGATYR